jgi:hypothetical protein
MVRVQSCQPEITEKFFDFCAELKFSKKYKGYLKLWSSGTIVRDSFRFVIGKPIQNFLETIF